MARSEGNPLYAEELLAANQDANTEGVPDHLSDLLLARIDALDEGPRALLRLSSVNGTRLDTETLAELAGLDQTQMEGYLREALDANVLRQTAGSLEFRHPLLREAAYDDLMPDERTRIHARLAEILQARVDSDPDPGVAALSRLAFHWNAAHDLPRTLSASVRAGLAAKRLAAAEVLIQFERALSLWDRVPDAETVAGHPRAEIVLLLGESATEQGDAERGYALVLTAVDMLGPDPDRLLASRVFSALGVADVPEATVGRQEAIRRAVEYAGDSPTEELALALIAQSQYLYSITTSPTVSEPQQRAIDAARSAGCVEAELDGLTSGCLLPFLLGHIGDALAGLERTVAVARTAGTVGRRGLRHRPLATRYMMAGQVDRGLALASEGFEEGLAQGLPAQAAACGEAALQALVWRGRFDEAEQLLEELGELREWVGLQAQPARSCCWPVVTRTGRPPWYESPRPPGRKIGGIRAPLMSWPRSDSPRCWTTKTALSRSRGRAWPTRRTPTPRCVRPRSHGSASRRSAWATRKPVSRTDELRDLSARQLASARGGLTDEWRPTYHGVQLALAEAYAARYAGEPAVAQFRAATNLAEPFGAYFAIEPRLNLAEELLAHGGRDEGRELLVECWSTAHDMGARDLERRAVSLATRTRIPLPHAAAREGPLSRLTPREREVLDLLSTGATNNTIATTLFITEKTASVHVSNILAKLGVANRGEAAALARQFVG